MQVDGAKLEQLLGRMVGDIGAAMSAVHVVVGDRLGLYRALAGGAGTPKELAQRTGTNERMVREWLLNQAASGYVEYDKDRQSYSMTPEQAMALADESSPAAMNGAFDIITSVHRDTDRLVEVFRSGQGLPWGAHDRCLFCGTERFFAANYRANLIESWIPALEGVYAKLQRGAQVADVGCGHGASTILLAKAFPKSAFRGFDFHEPSIECARRHAKEAGADAMVTPCPLCHLSLDAWQSKLKKRYGKDFQMPILHLSQLVGVAAGLTDSELKFRRHVVSVAPVVEKLSV